MRMTVWVFHNIYLFSQTTKVVALASDSWNSAHRWVPSGLSAEKDRTGMQAWAQMTGLEKQCLCQAKAIPPAQPPLREPGLRRGHREWKTWPFVTAQSRAAECAKQEVGFGYR